MNFRPFLVARAIVVLGAVWFPSLASAQGTGTALVGHAPALNGGTLDGSLQQIFAENVTLNGGVTVTGDLLVPGTPAVRLNGRPVYGGTLDGPGGAAPSAYQVTLNGNVSLRHVVRRSTAPALPTVTAPPISNGTRTVTINSAGQSAGDFATLRHLTLNGNVGQFAIPPGTYGDFTANAGSGFTLGIAGATEASVYNVRQLTLNGPAQLQVLGPVVLNVANGFAANGTLGNSAHPSRLTLNFYSGGVTLNGGCSLHGHVNAPSGSVVINGNSQLIGGVVADRLVLNGGGLFRLQVAPLLNQPPIAAAQSILTNEDIAKPVMLSGTDADGHPLVFAVTTPPLHGALSGTAPALVYTPFANYNGS
ncbi:MAG TPA: Ig-like domain-containing protein, partial [Opitutaceae bacterium]|nr:Ig-like domain-containing protein [Opitutaceae bacterium]